ncbi:MAG TPA: sugar transferase [Candidatus Binataceae bacterium]|nr:sugar transferase [Candidatus Binataceae bacterium]
MLSGELRKQKLLFAFGDAIALLTVFAMALRLHDPSHSIAKRFSEAGTAIEFLGVSAVLALWLVTLQWNDLYRFRNGGPREFVAILLACSEAALLTLLAFFLFHTGIARITVALAWAGSAFAVAGMRSLMRAAIEKLYANPKIAVPLLLVGFNPVSTYLCDQVLNELGPYEPVAFLDGSTAEQEYRGLPVDRIPQTFERLALRYPGAEVAIALPDSPREEIEEIARLCEDARLDWWLVPWLLPSLARGVKVEQIGIVPLIGRRGARIEGLNYAIKRLFDATLASFLTILTAPVMLIAGIAIVLDDGFPVLFRQKRIGVRGEPFEMLKLRTMQRNCDDSTHREFVSSWIRNSQRITAAPSAGNVKYKLTNDPRITRIGRILRRFSIDELPQLLNVIQGQMSLIGPRPGTPYELENYEKWHRRRLDAPPGITGLWQVSGRNDLSFDEMVRLDVQYLEDWSLVGDLKILARTLPALIRGSGV